MCGSLALDTEAAVGRPRGGRARCRARRKRTTRCPRACGRGRCRSGSAAIWATRSGSQSTSTARPAARALRSAVRAQRGRELAATSRASCAEVGRLGPQLERAGLQAERSSSSVASLRRRSTWSRTCSTNWRRVSSSSSSSASSSRKPPSEKIGVRSSCEAVAMNCLRAESSWASWRCMSSNAAASWPSSSSESTGMRVGEVAARRPRGGRSRRSTRGDSARDHEVAGEHRERRSASAPATGSARRIDRDVAPRRRSAATEKTTTRGDAACRGSAARGLGDAAAVAGSVPSRACRRAPRRAPAELEVADLDRAGSSSRRSRCSSASPCDAAAAASRARSRASPAARTSRSSVCRVDAVRGRTSVARSARAGGVAGRELLRRAAATQLRHDVEVDARRSRRA